jgi:hypothetical protein
VAIGKFTLAELDEEEQRRERLRRCIVTFACVTS